MSDLKNQQLLRNKRAVEEIGRHRWIESEKAGHDIGFARASTDWLEKFSTAWMQYHIPKKEAPASKAARTSAAKKTTKRKTSKSTSVRKKSK